MTSKAQTLRALHVKGSPLVLFNIWDAGSAQAVAKSGALAVATGSWSVAGAQGFADGQALPLDDLLRAAAQIVQSVDVPVSIDFEGGYATAPDEITANVTRLAATGAVGLNFEDQIIGGDGLHPLEEQAARVAAVRSASSDMVINARTDLFLKEKDASRHADLLQAATERGLAFTEAGADCVFVPGLSDLDLIASLCEALPTPVNVMHAGAPDAIAALAQAGVGRISHGPGPYRAAMAWIEQQAQAVLGR